MNVPAPRSSATPVPAAFATTAWSVVLRSASPDSPEARPALEYLCKAYWQPLFEFACRLGRNRGEAEDHVQSFFAHLIQANSLRYADPNRGRFRNFLLASFRQHIAHLGEHATAAKRRPTEPLLSLDAALESHHLDGGLAEDASPDRMFEYTWAVTVLDRARYKLQSEYQVRSERFDALQSLLGGAETPDLASQLGLSPGATRVAVHRFRQRYAELVRAEIRATVDSDAEVEYELNDLLDAVRKSRSF